MEAVGPGTVAVETVEAAAARGAVVVKAVGLGTVAVETVEAAAATGVVAVKAVGPGTVAIEAVAAGAMVEAAMEASGVRRERDGSGRYRPLFARLLSFCWFVGFIAFIWRFSRHPS